MCCCYCFEVFGYVLAGIRKPLHESDGSRLSRFYEDQAEDGAPSFDAIAPTPSSSDNITSPSR